MIKENIDKQRGVERKGCTKNTRFSQEERYKRALIEIVPENESD